MKLYRKWADYVIDGDQGVEEVVSSILQVTNLKALGIRTM